VWIIQQPAGNGILEVLREHNRHGGELEASAGPDESYFHFLYPISFLIFNVKIENSNINPIKLGDKFSL